MEIRLAFRRILCDRGASAAIALAVGLGIAVNCALFAVLDGLRFRDLPFDRPDELVAVDYRAVAGGPPELAYRIDLTEERQAIRDRLENTATSATQYGQASFFNEQPPNVRTSGIDSRFFGLLGLEPMLGRDFDSDDEKSPALRTRDSVVPLPIIVGHGLWQSHFGGMASVVGQEADFAGRRVRLVGVMPRGVKFPGETNVWAPVSSDRSSPPRLVRMGGEASLDGLAGAFPELQFTPLRETIRPRDSVVVGLVFAASTLLVLVTWIQVAGIVSSETLGRAREYGIQLALGASRMRFLRKFWTEGAVMLTAALCVAAVAVMPITTLVIANLPDELRSGQYLTPGVRTVLFGSAVAGVGLALVSLLPFLILRRSTAASLLLAHVRGVSYRASRTRVALLVGQMALTSALLYLAALAINSDVRARFFDHGFDTEQVLAFWPPATFVPGETRAEHDAAIVERRRLVDESVEVLNASTAVVAAAPVLAVETPGLPSPPETSIARFDGRALYPALSVRATGAGPRFIEALGATLVGGRDFRSPELAGRRDVVIINETLAEMLAPSDVLMGVDIRPRVVGSRVETSWFQGEVIGIVKDLVDSAPGSAPVAQMFVPHLHPNFGADVITINAAAPLTASLPQIREALESVWGSAPPGKFGLVSEELSRALAPFRARSTLLGTIAFLGLPVAWVGLAGTLLQSIRSRERETAIRIALGAVSSRVARSVRLAALASVGVGLIVGLGAGAVLANGIEHQLFGVAPVDGLTVCAVVGLMLGVGWLVTSWPAARIARAQPAALLRIGQEHP